MCASTFCSAASGSLFSELTFSGGAARNPFVPLVKNVELGRMIDLDRAPDYLARGQRIAAALGWQGARATAARTAFPVRRSASPAFGYPAQEV